MKIGYKKKIMKNINYLNNTTVLNMNLNLMKNIKTI
jgi:hypothetical protein